MRLVKCLIPDAGDRLRGGRRVRAEDEPDVDAARPRRRPR